MSRTVTAPLPVVYSAFVAVADTWRELNLVVVDHQDVCGAQHVHRSRGLAPFVRRTRCGGGRYLVVPLVAPALKYGRDHGDTGWWADEDGNVWDEHDQLVKRGAAA